MSSDNTRRTRWSASSMGVERAERVLYSKHCIDHPLLRGFNDYLHVNGIQNIDRKQEVDVVSRFLFYMDPTEPNMTFVLKVEQVSEYFDTLASTWLTQQTVLRCWKSLHRFMTYIITASDIRYTSPELLQDCQRFMDPLVGIRQAIARR